MEERTIILSKEQLLLITSSIIIAGMAANFSTVCPSDSHALIAKGVAQRLMDTVLK